MQADQKTARIVGLLFLLQLVAAAISYSVLLDPILHVPDFLSVLYANLTTVKMAMFLDLICGAALVSIAVLLYPVLKKYSESIALWYVGLRSIEFATIIVSGIFLMTLSSISQKYVQVEATETATLQLLGDILLRGRGWTQNMTILIYCLGASMFYYLLYSSRLLPRFISIWGLIAVGLLFTEIILNTFGAGYGQLLMLPMGLNEIVLGIWLMVKGFRSSME